MGLGPESFGAGVRELEICNQGFGAANAIGGGAHNAAGISGTLAARVEARGQRGVARSIAGNGDR